MKTSRGAVGGGVPSMTGPQPVRLSYARPSLQYRLPTAEGDIGADTPPDRLLPTQTTKSESKDSLNCPFLFDDPGLLDEVRLACDV